MQYDEDADRRAHTSRGLARARHIHKRAPCVHSIWIILHSTALNANKYEDTQNNVQRVATSTFDPGGHLASLDVARLLPLHLPWVTGDAASYARVSRDIRIMRKTVHQTSA